MNINRKAEVAMHCIAADIEFTVERLSENDWKFNIKDTSGLADYDQKEIELHLTDAQCAATMALFVGEVDDDPLNDSVHNAAYLAWLDVPINLRIIP